MCGILALLYAGTASVKLPASAHEGGAKAYASNAADVDELVKKLGARQAHRGPDAQAVLSGSGWALAHQRLSIMDPVESSNQPFIFDDDTALAGIRLVHNGEIYNHEELYQKLSAEGHTITRHTKTDSEVILHCYAAWGWERCMQELSGMFAIVIIDERDKGAPQVLAARDHVGIKPLYMAVDSARGVTLFSSELKAIHDMVDHTLPSVHIALVPAGCAWVRHMESANNAQNIQAGEGVTWRKFWKPEWDCPGYSQALTERPTRAQVRQALKTAVHRRMMSHVPYGALLSGGVDSCIVTCLMVEIAREYNLDYNWPDGKLRTYTVGMEGSPDIMAAREMARHLGTVHHERLFTAAEACKIVPKVVYHMETYEPELLRSAIPNYFLAEIASSQVKMVLTGEGADELFAGYLYFRDCPHPPALQDECRRIFAHLENVNLQRADRMSMAHGLEARVPFLDLNFIQVAMSVDPACKMIVKGDDTRRETKQYLREIFAGDASVPEGEAQAGFVPHGLLFRTKAMQCEGVGKGWVQTLQEYASEQVSEEEFAELRRKYPRNPPESREEAWYRKLFEERFPGQDKFVHVWENGCRAGGASWKSETYTRAGLCDTDQLHHEFMDAN